MIYQYIAYGMAWAIGFSIVGVASSYFGTIGFLLVVGIGIGLFMAYRQMPIDRWRWKMRRYLQKR